MPYIQLGINLNDQLGIKSVIVEHNDTGFADDSKLIEMVATALLKGLRMNKDSIQVQELLKELGIERGS